MPSNIVTRANSSADPSHQEVEANVDHASRTALADAKRNFKFLINPSTSTHTPSRLRTRALLRALHYLSVFIFWRVVRYAKYALMGALVAAVSATAFGSVITGAAWLVAPPSIAASTGLGILWAVGRWGFRKASQRTKTAKETGAYDRMTVPEPGFLEDTFA